MKNLSYHARLDRSHFSFVLPLALFLLSLPFLGTELGNALRVLSKGGYCEDRVCGPERDEW